MPKLTNNKLPAYRRHKASGQAVVTLSGRDVYLGPYGTEVSRAEYDRVVSEWIANGRSLGIFKPPKLEPGKPRKKAGLGEDFWIELCGRAVPAKNTQDGVRAVVKDKPIDPGQVQGYLQRSFGDDLTTVQQEMAKLASSLDSEDLAEQAFSLYETFRPAIARGKRGWGQKGELDLDQIRSMARKS